MKRWLSVLVLGCLLLVILMFSWKFLVPVLTSKPVDDSIPVSQGAVQEAITNGFIAQVRNADYTRFSSGQVLFLREGDRSILRFENFGTSGSDLSVWLAKSLNSSERLFVGDVRPVSSSQNINLSSEMSIVDYPYVLLWHNRSSTLYGWAKFGS